MADTYFAFVTNATDGTVSTFRLGGDARLTRLDVTPIGPGCGTLAVDPGRRRVYVGVKAAEGGSPGIVTAAVDSEGWLQVLGRRDLPDAVHFLALSEDGGTLLAASYGGGFGAVLPVDDDVVGEITCRVDYPNMHSCAISADGRTAYFVSLGDDLIAQYALADHQLTALDPPTVAAPHGSGPRHLVLNRAESSVYVLTEFSGEVLHYRRAADGTLTAAGQVSAVDPAAELSHSRFGADPAAERLIWGADLHLSPNEHVLWASERTASTLATVPLDRDGAPQPAVQFVETEQQPRGFAVTPDGAFVLSAGEKSQDVSLFAVLPEHQTLEWMERTETGGGANWVRFLPVD